MHAAIIPFLMKFIEYSENGGYSGVIWGEPGTGIPGIG
jgi:hypothetical protein